MGLEYTEFAMRLEERFNLLIEDEFLELQTVGDLYFNLMTTLQAQPHRPCRTSTTFFAIRNKIIEIAGVARSDLSLSTALRQVLTIRQRRKLWYEFERTAGLRLPPLRAVVPDSFLLLFSAVSGITIGIFLMAGSIALDLQFMAWVCASGVLVFPFIIGIPLQRALTLSFPDSCSNIGDLVTATVNDTYSARGWTSDVVWQGLRDAIAEVWEIDPDQIQPDLRLEDLG